MLHRIEQKRLSVFKQLLEGDIVFSKTEYDIIENKTFKWHHTILRHEISCCFEYDLPFCNKFWILFQIY